ncbi:MAG: DNA-protecting protein DprA [Campylobacterales bacterium]|nr:DNA-protecting protein DprA [Campylobacterales bacterium]
MIHQIDFHIKQLESMKKYPSSIKYIGDTNLLQKPLISIVGSRKPNQYTKQFTFTLAQKLSQSGFVVVSGAAMGVDAIAHQGATPSSTIAVAATGLFHRYPAVNSELIKSIENKGLVLSIFDDDFKATNYSFVLRNELVVALGQVLVVTQADINSGTIRSVEYALSMGKEIFVLPHRIGESEGTNELLKNGKAKAIYDLDTFIHSLGIPTISSNTIDDIESYFLSSPLYDDAMAKYPDKVFEYELSGKITVKNGKVIPL